MHIVAGEPHSVSSLELGLGFGLGALKKESGDQS